MTRSARVAAVALASLAPLLAACGVQPDDAPRAIAADRVPYGLLDDAPSVAPPTTLTPAVERASVLVYFVVADRLQPAVRAVQAPPTPARAVAALLAGPTDEEAVNGLRTAINPTTQASVTRPAPELVTIELTADFAAVPALEQRLAIGQLVFTVTGVDGVRGALFTVGGAPVAVPLPDGTVTSEPVSREAFPAIAPMDPPSAPGPA